MNGNRDAEAALRSFAADLSALLSRHGASIELERVEMAGEWGGQDEWGIRVSAGQWECKPVSNLGHGLELEEYSW